VIYYIACYMVNRYGATHTAVGATPWLVLGDLNVEPSGLAGIPNAAINMGNLILRPYEKTYLGPNRNKEFDYAICNFQAQATIRRVRATPRLHGSDHYPILIEF
jgi:hypothetical protein